MVVGRARLSWSLIISESVGNFDASDLTVVNATVGNFSGFGQNYSFDLTPLGQGEVSVLVAAGKASDAAGNLSTVSNTISVIYDTVAPSVTLSTTASDPTSVSPIPVTVDFDESVTGFDAGDLIVSPGKSLCEFGSGTDALDTKTESKHWVSDRFWELESGRCLDPVRPRDGRSWPKALF